MAAVPLHNPRAPGPTLGVTAYGRPALTALREAITTAKGADPLAPVTVVVPDNFVGVAARRGLARGHHGTVVPGRIGLAGANFVTIDRLAQLLAAPAMARDGRRPVNKPIIAAAVRRVLAKRSGVFAAVAQHPTTELRLVEAHRELSSLGPAELNALAATSARSRDVVRVHREVSTILSHGWYGEHDLLLAASRAVSANSAGLSTLGPVIVYLPQDVSPAGAELLQALGSRVPCTILAGLTGVDAADATVLASLGRLGIAPPPAPAPAHTNIEVVSVSDADDEVRHVVRAIVDAARAGTPFDRMAVVYPKQRPYARLLHDHLEGAGIVHN
ncbi:MAG: PD-(D/E)XK nuclease family protein, partial [Acidimicrobiales bacterium]